VALAVQPFTNILFHLLVVPESATSPNDSYVFQFRRCVHLIPEMCWADGFIFIIIIIIIIILDDYSVIFEIFSAFSDITHSLCASTYINRIYTGCPRRNVPDFVRVSLVLKYTDITQNTYIQS
jgi:hypothetical protein